MQNSALKTLLACEDVRYEIGHKATIVGVFSGVVLDDFPRAIRLALWLEYLVKEAGKYNFSVRVDTPTVESAVVIDLEVEAKEPFETLVTGIPPFPLKIEKCGEISIFTKETKNKKWDLSRKIKIEKGESESLYPIRYKNK